MSASIAKQPLSISSMLDHAWNTLSETAFSTAWSPLSRMAESAVIALMQRITTGQLRVLTYSTIYDFPPLPLSNDNTRPDLKAELRVLNDSFWLRLCTMGDLGFAEAYMYGDVECDDLVSLFQIFLENRENLSNLDSRLSYLFTLPQKITQYRFLNTIGNSRSNISAHYDISNDMFAAFLSKDMTYSCAIFPELDGDLKDNGRRTATTSPYSGGAGLKRIAATNGPISISNSSNNNDGNSHISENGTAISKEDPLYLAQLAKLDHIINKLHINPHNRLLEIGTGWGALALRVAKLYPTVTIDTITLSSSQAALARARFDEAGESVSSRITVHLMDYRHMPKEWEGAFDRVVSVEMIEAVGKEFLETYWQVVDWAMKKKAAVGVVQVITIPEARFERYIREVDFIQKWVLFPGGFLPTLTLLLQTLQAGSRGKLVVDSVSNIGPHYARTLREWRRRFLAEFEGAIVDALKRDYPELFEGAEGSAKGRKGREEVEVFKRKWIYYYCYCEVGFTTRTLGDHIITFVREGYEDFGCDVFS